MLHSLIGLPTMLSPPAGQTWVIIDDDLRPGSDANSRGWKKERAYSGKEGQLDGKTMEEISELKENWIAHRGTNGGQGGGGGGRRGNVIAEGDKTKEESTSPFPEPSSEPLGTVYVFRFPSSPFRYGYSDYYSPDVDQQLEWTKKHKIRSLHGSEYFPFGFPRCSFGPLHPFMFSPFAGLPLHHIHHDQVDQALDEIEFRSRVRDALLVCCKKCYHGDEVKNESSTKNWIGNYSGPSSNTQLSFATQDRKEEARSDPEAELELYEHFEAMNPTPSRDSSTSSRVVGSSISTQSRTLPDGSSWSKTVKIIRFDDGREEREEEEQSKPPITDYSRAPSGDRRPPLQMGEKDCKDDSLSNFCLSDRNSGKAGLQNRFARQDPFSGEKLWECLSDALQKPDDEHDESREISKRSDSQHHEILPDAANHSLAKEAKSQQGWGWFWKK